MLLDPFLSPYDGRLHDSPLAPDECVGIDVVFCSHEHVDHLDVPSIDAIATASPGAVFVVPSPIVDMVTEAGVPSDRVVGHAARRLRGDRRPDRARGARVPRGDHGRRVRVRRDACPDGLVRFLGFVIDLGGVRIYHAGDTIHFDGMEETLAPLGIDVALLPINGRDAERERRGIVGNLDHREAAWLGSRIDAGLLVPMHYDLFARNLGFPGRARRDGRPRVPRRSRPGAGARPAVRLHDEAGTRVRALVYLGPGRMELQDAPDPTPGPGEVVIASRASSICGSDLHGFREASPRRIPPLIMGHETVGEIAEVGKGVPARPARRARGAEADRVLRRLPLVPGGGDQPLRRPDGWWDAT